MGKNRVEIVPGPQEPAVAMATTGVVAVVYGVLALVESQWLWSTVATVLLVSGVTLLVGAVVTFQVVKGRDGGR